MVFHSFFQYLFLIVFFVFVESKNNLNRSKTNPNISFLEADISEEGVVIKEVKTDIKPKKNKKIKGSVNQVFFSFIGGESVFNNVNCSMNYDLNWFLSIKKISLFQKTYVINNFYLKNNVSFFIKIGKVSNIGKVSALNVEIGSNEPMGWKASSKFVNYDEKNSEIICLDNKFGLGKTKFKFFNLNFSTKPRSGWIPISGIVKDFGEKSYASFGYYILSKDESTDFSFYPMFYCKDFGSSFQIRSLKYNIELNAQLERLVSYCRYKNKDIKKITPSNFVFNFKSNNKFLDADFHIFNKKFYNEKIWKNMNYQNFLPLGRDYWGCAYFNFGVLKLNLLQRNDQHAIKWILDITNFLKITAEETFDKKMFANIVLFKDIYADIDLCLIDVKGELKYKFVEKYDYTRINKKNIGLKANFKIDSPILYLDGNCVKGAFFFNADGQAVDFINYFKKNKKLPDDFKLSLGAEGVYSLKSFDMKIFYKNKKEFGLEFANFQRYLDSFSIEKKEEKTFISFIFLETSKCYGIRIAKDQLLLEFLYTCFDCLKFQFLGSYHFEEKFFKNSNLYHKDTYINFGVELMTKSWKIRIGSGIKNSPEQGTFSIYSVSVFPIEQMSFSEIEEIFKDIDKEKEKILNLYDEF